MFARFVSRPRATVLAAFAALVVSLGGAGSSSAAVGDVTIFHTGYRSNGTAGLTVGPDGNFWFTNDFSGHPEIGRMTPTGTYTYFGDSSTIQPQANLAGISAGADGNVWFTEADTGDVGRITPTGTITEFELTNSTTSMFDIVSGPDGNLWIAEGDRQMIGRLPTTGSGLTEFGPVTGARPYSITTGPDGNLWFGEFTNKIGRITPAGNITEFSTGSHWGWDVTGGPDGNIWFTVLANGPGDRGGIHRIGTDGSGLTEFTNGLSDASLNSIAAGADGNLWFSEYGLPPRIGRITPAGVITEFSSGFEPNSPPEQITAGPDGNIWFTSAYGVGRVITGASPPGPSLTVTVGGNGSGTVTGSGISCPGACTATYPAGTQVTLNATPALGSTFAGWSGACSGTGACNTTVNGPTFVAADFASAKVEKGAKIGKRKVKVRNGRFTISVVNANNVTVDASVTFTGTIEEVEVPKAEKKPIKLGQKKFTVPAQGSTKVKVKLAKKGVAYLKTHKSLKVKAKIVFKANGTSKTSTQKLTLLAPKK